MEPTNMLVMKKDSSAPNYLEDYKKVTELEKRITHGAYSMNNPLRDEGFEYMPDVFIADLERDNNLLVL